ncbi:Gfo/Idh/MocA family protein [Bythopirellula polymerisocia]|uniref:Putative oxidoreductase YdgJ n=1 Tax=Bythopirellula polymerisocia TaxID=2528003 RepID=A0A5C6CXY5_9BACT|nr:Gfo/Idh/MocA family oxidoreductase [Bythopirellula polymerisocia]TWU27509.1 putative oxidoreductase YdgJ [Bythopirellula polymerisocia]
MLHSSSRREFLFQRFPLAALATTAVCSSTSTAAATTPRRIKVGQIGVGHSHAAGKIQVLRGSPDWEVVGVVESDPDLRAQAQKSEEYQGLPFITAEQLLNTPDVEAVAVETMVEQLLPIAHQCIAAGKHIHLDKPPGSSLESFRELLANADRQQLVVQLGYMYRYNPAILLLRDLLAKGWLGEIFEFNAVMSKVVDPPKRSLWAQNPGGTMFELGCHLVDLLVLTMGKPEEVTPYSHHSARINDTLLDNMLAVCSYPRATATIRSTALEVDGGDRRHLVVCGTEGTLHIQPLDEPRVQLALSEPRGEYREGYQEINFGKYNRYTADLADLAAIIRGEKQADFDSAHDLATQETLLRACGLPC